MTHVFVGQTHIKASFVERSGRRFVFAGVRQPIEAGKEIMVLVQDERGLARLVLDRCAVEVTEPDSGDLVLVARDVVDV